MTLKLTTQYTIKGETILELFDKTEPENTISDFLEKQDYTNFNIGKPKF